MPVIPSVNEQQVLNPGSPVNAISGPEGRLEGDAIAQLGNSLMKYGITEREKNTRDTIGEELLHHEVQAIVENAKLQHMATALDPNEVDGSIKVSAYTKDVNARVDKYIAENKTYSNDVKRGARAKIGSDINTSATLIGVNEIKKIADTNSAMAGQLTIAEAHKVAIDASYMPTAMDKIELLTRKTTAHPALTEKEIKDNQEMLVNTVINKKLGEPTVLSFDESRAIVEKYGAQVYRDPVKLAAVLDKIVSKEHAFVQNQKTQFEYNKMFTDRDIKEKQIKMYTELVRQRDEVGTDPTKQMALYRTAGNMAAVGSITNEQYEHLTKPAAQAKLVDENFEFKIMSDYMVKGKTEEGNNVIRSAQAAGLVSPSMATSLLEKLRKHDGMHGDAKTMLATARVQITDYKKSDPIFAHIPNVGLLSDTLFKNTVNSAASEFTKWALQNPDKWQVYPEKANEIVRNRIRAQTFDKHIKYNKQFNSVEEVQKEMVRVAAQASVDKQNGKFNGQALDRELKALNAKKQQLMESKSYNDSTKGTTKNVQSGDM